MDSRLISLNPRRREVAVPTGGPLLTVAGAASGPHGRPPEDHDVIGEERRPLHVGMTRVREFLILTGARSRRIFCLPQLPRPSRSLAEIPPRRLREPGDLEDEAVSGNGARILQAALTRPRYAPLENL
jgi:hypothetical protein